MALLHDSCAKHLLNMLRIFLNIVQIIFDKYKKNNRKCMKNTTNEIDKEKQNQMLKLVTNSFFKELKNYGVENKDIVKVSVNLLDYVTSAQEEQASGTGTYNDTFTIGDIRNNFPANHTLSIKDVSLKPLDIDMLPQLAAWLTAPEIKQTLIRFFPTNIKDLEYYFFGRTRRNYFAVFYKQENYVGIIGADNIEAAPNTVLDTEAGGTFGDVVTVAYKKFFEEYHSASIPIYLH